MKRLLFVLLFFCCFSISVVAYSDSLDLSTLCTYHEIVGEEIPRGLPFGDDVVSVYLANDSVGSVVLVDSIVDSVSCEENNESTYVVYVKDQSVIDDIFASNDSLGEFTQKWGDDDIVISAVGFIPKVKLAFVKFLSWFF